MMKSVGKLFGLRRKSAPPKSRIDSKKTRVNPIDRMLDDSDEGSYGSTTSDSSESEYRTSDDEPGSSDSSYRARASDSDDSSETDEKSAVSRRQRKRSASATALNDDSSDSSSDVGGEPLRRVLQRKRLRLPEDSEDEALKKKKRQAEVKQAAAKRRERKNKLMELSKRRKSGTVRRRRRTMGSDEEEEEEEVEKEEVKGDKPEEPSKADKSEDESSVEEKGSPLNSSEEEKLADSDSLKDFIVEEDEQKKVDEPEEEGEGKDKAFLSHLPRQFITGSQRTHFQVVVKALLINVLDSTFLKSLYGGERTKRYAQEMKSSLHHFDERLVLPRLENLKQRSRWKERYKERVECYPTLRVMEIRVHSKGCEACELHRTGRFSVRLSGQLYHNNSLQEDNFMPDDSQCFFVGSVCASRTEVYHALKHFKYHLFQGCRRALEAQKEGEEEGDKDVEEDEPVKDTVNKVFAKLQEGGWISEQYEKFQEHLNSADFFQEEKLD